ncbi:hypothetical protein V8F20_001748 [Naviculisporaceae sp. PSN 640]
MSPAEPPISQPARLVVAYGSTTFLNDFDLYFWSGKTLGTLRFNDRRSWILQTHNNGDRPPHPGEDLPKTTIYDIVDIIRYLTHLHSLVPLFRVNRDGTNNLRVYPNSHGWVVMYLNTSEENNTVAFRQAVLERFPPPESDDNRHTCTVLEMFVRGIDPHFRDLLGFYCPHDAQILVMMKVHHSCPIQKAVGYTYFSGSLG